MKKILFIYLITSLGCYSQIMNTQKNNQIEMPFSIDCLRNKNNLKDETVVEEYVKLDSLVIENIFNKVPSFSSNIDSLITLIPDLLIGDGNVSLYILDLGKELNLIKYTMYGGYGTFEFEILHFGNKILRVNQYISSYSELIESRYLTLIKVPLTISVLFAVNPNLVNKWRIKPS